ncbi:putative photosynthetic complex assembly protein [Cereibacter ovatus]|uniref:Putative photosynthetic complex assembly protein n=1 Tax=Cereibacter ovatus TaxID=439529 RepID=A0A285CWT2_9RHOB|nr:photosynthetic complex assembly protein PuhC [Cereibacter ovatus]SNX72012.1 putative photosynthetic complex assembly protein [Cereibacter ovatus]
MTNPNAPRRKPEPEKELIPPFMVKGMFALALGSLAIASYAVLTGREPTGQPQAAPVVAERPLILEGLGKQAVEVRSPEGDILFQAEDGGFVAVIKIGLARARTVHRVDGNPPVRLVKYENGRLSLQDDATGWSTELQAFGEDNKAIFDRLLSE